MISLLGMDWWMGERRECLHWDPSIPNKSGVAVFEARWHWRNNLISGGTPIITMYPSSYLLMLSFLVVFLIFWHDCDHWHNNFLLLTVSSIWHWGSGRTETDVLCPRQKSTGIPKVSHKLYLSLFQLKGWLLASLSFYRSCWSWYQKIYYGTLCNPTGHSYSVSTTVIYHLILLVILTSNVTPTAIHK